MGAYCQEHLSFPIPSHATLPPQFLPSHPSSPGPPPSVSTAAHTPLRILVAGPKFNITPDLGQQLPCAVAAQPAQHGQLSLLHTLQVQGTAIHFEASTQLDEDWTKVSNPAKRRRIQNRLAQRKYRRKLKHSKGAEHCAQSPESDKFQNHVPAAAQKGQDTSMAGKDKTLREQQSKQQHDSAAFPLAFSASKVQSAKRAVSMQTTPQGETVDVFTMYTNPRNTSHAPLSTYSPSPYSPISFLNGNLLTNYTTAEVDPDMLMATNVYAMIPAQTCFADPSTWSSYGSNYDCGSSLYLDAGDDGSSY